MRFVFLLFVLLFPFFVVSVKGQMMPAATVPSPGSAPKIEVPRQLTLEKAEEILLRTNLTVTAARYGVEIARAQRLIASLRPNPTITFGSEQFDIGHPFRNLFSTDSNTAANRVYTYRFDQILERGDKRRLRTEAAEFQLQAAEAQVLDATRQQMFQLKQAFFTAVLARENLRAADENLYLINNTEQLIKLHVDAGDTAEWELTKFQVNRVQYQRDLVSAQLSYQQSVRDVLNLLGGQPSSVVGTITAGGPDQMPSLLADSPLEIVGDLRVEPVSMSLSEITDAALNYRPDVIAARRNLDAAGRAFNLANALRHRDIDVAAEYQRNGGENTIGIVVTVPLFLHNNHQGEINQALAQLQQSKAQLAQAELQAMTEVDKAYRAYESSQRMLGVYTAETLQKAEESFRIAGVSYKEGATSLLELRDAQRTYNLTRVASNQAHFDYRMSLYQLELATGRKLLK
jgi:cobalt-zinc-cadmium efflux system outer membrane protein